MTLALKKKTDLQKDENEWDEPWRDEYSREEVAWDDDCEVVARSSRQLSDWARIAEPKQDSTSSSPTASVSSMSKQIEDIYTEIAQLQSHLDTSNREQIEKRIDEKLDRLRDLQAREAERMRKVFESQLEMPLGAGQEAIDRADSLLENYEDSSTED